jgi:uncharacterized protein YjbJ (UPF0337 family)
MEEDSSHVRRQGRTGTLEPVGGWFDEEVGKSPVHRTRRDTMGELKDKAKGIGNELAGNAKQMSDDPDTRAEGHAQETKGEVQNLKGKVEGAFGNKI